MAWRGNNNADEDDFDGSITNLQASAQRSRTGGMTRLEQLEHEMKLLSWHKLANEAALKAAIIRTKNLKKHDKLQMQRDRNRERAAWMEQIIREEQMKPLEVNTHFIKEYEEKEKQADAALERTIEHHLHNLRKLKKSIEDKDKIRQRKEKFYAKREEVRAMLAGTVTDAGGPGSRSRQGTSGSGRSGYGQSGSPQPAPNSSEDGREAESNRAVNLVVGSLDKLMKLEQRINKLEQNVQEKKQLEKKTAGSLSQLGMLRFRKKKIEASLRSPAQTRFSVSMNARNNPTHPENNSTDDEEDQDGQAKVNNWMKQRKLQLKQARRKREKLALANRKKARAMGSRSARSVAADFKNMKRNDPRNKGRSSRGGSTRLPPINCGRRQAW